MKLTASDQAKALALISYATNLRAFGEDPHVGTWQGWDAAANDFLQGLKLEARENYTPLNENPPMKGNIMSEETKTENVTPIVLAPVPEKKQKLRLTKKTKIMCGVAVAAIAAGAVALFTSDPYSEVDNLLDPSDDSADLSDVPPLEA